MGRAGRYLRKCRTPDLNGLPLPLSWKARHRVDLMERRRVRPLASTSSKSRRPYDTDEERRDRPRSQIINAMSIKRPERAQKNTMVRPSTLFALCTAENPSALNAGTTKKDATKSTTP